MTTRDRVIAALLARLGEIGPERDYATDAGQRVHHGTPTLSPDDPMPLIILSPIGEAALVGSGLGDGTRVGPGNAGRVTVRQGFRALGLLKAEPANPLDPVEALRGDLKRALFRPEDIELGGLLTLEHGLEYAGEGTADREAGGEHVSCWVDCLATWREVYGAP